MTILKNSLSMFSRAYDFRPYSQYRHALPLVEQASGPSKRVDGCPIDNISISASVAYLVCQVGAGIQGPALDKSIGEFSPPELCVPLLATRKESLAQLKIRFPMSCNSVCCLQQ